MTEQYHVRLLKEQLTFSAAHFITYGDNVCERLHGHNYGVRCSVTGSLNEHGYVVDFIALRDQLAEIASALDHHVLLPTDHPTINVAIEDQEVVVNFEQRRWIFPLEDCVLLPISNTTAELLAAYIASTLIANADEWSHSGINRICVGVDENQGQWGEYEIEL